MSEYCLRSDIFVNEILSSEEGFGVFADCLVVRSLDFWYRELRMSRGLYLPAGPSGGPMEHAIRSVLRTVSKIREWSNSACVRVWLSSSSHDLVSEISSDY